MWAQIAPSAAADRRMWAHIAPPALGEGDEGAAPPGQAPAVGALRGFAALRRPSADPAAPAAPLPAAARRAARRARGLEGPSDQGKGAKPTAWPSHVVSRHHRSAPHDG
jgi:hypothetical protein